MEALHLRSCGRNRRSAFKRGVAPRYPILYHFDGTDDIALFEIDETGNRAYPAIFSFNAQTGTTSTVLKTDRQKIVTHSNASAIAVTLPQATGDFGAGFFYAERNLGAGLVTITPATSTIDDRTGNPVGARRRDD